jgi:tetratricopeptide (TPR) repeat protein
MLLLKWHPLLALRLLILNSHRPMNPLMPGTLRLTRRCVALCALVAGLSCSFAIRAATADDAPPINIPPELSDAARRAYSQSLKEAGEMVAQRNYMGAITKLDELIAQRPREPQARFLKGIAQTEQGQTADAFATFLALVADYPELPEPHNNLAVLYAQKGEYDLARSELEMAIKTAPNWPVARENLGDIYARMAALQYERASTLDRANKTAPAKLALVGQLLTPAKPKP